MDENQITIVMRDWKTLRRIPREAFVKQTEALINKLISIGLLVGENYQEVLQLKPSADEPALVPPLQQFLEGGETMNDGSDMGGGAPEATVHSAATTSAAQDSAKVPGASISKRLDVPDHLRTAFYGHRRAHLRACEELRHIGIEPDQKLLTCSFIGCQAENMPLSMMVPDPDYQRLLDMGRDPTQCFPELRPFWYQLSPEMLALQGLDPRETWFSCVAHVEHNYEWFEAEMNRLRPPHMNYHEYLESIVAWAADRVGYMTRLRNPFRARILSVACLEVELPKHRARGKLGEAMAGGITTSLVSITDELTRNMFDYKVDDSALGKHEQLG